MKQNLDCKLMPLLAESPAKTAHGSTRRSHGDAFVCKSAFLR